MKIRNKITLWIALTSITAALGFAVFVFVEFLEEPVKLIDAELGHMAEALVSRNIALAGGGGAVDASRLPFPPGLYWIRVSDARGRVLYRSRLAAAINLPERGEKAWFFETIIPRDRFQLGQDSHDEVTFRINRRMIRVDGRDYRVMIAKPVEEIEEELIDLVCEVVAGLVTFTLLFGLASYFIAGRILAPVEAINRLARKITGHTLDRRIPVGDNRDELSELSRTLNLMFDRLQHSFTRQKQFLAAAAHELKSPLTLMMLSQEELLRRSDNSAELAEELERQLDTMRRLKLLLNKLLDLSRLEIGDGIIPEEMAPGSLAVSLLEEYRELIDHEGLAVTGDIAAETRMQGDPGKIRRLLINLLDNAIRYNRPGGRIEFDVTAAGDGINIRIGNSGPGVPVVDITRVFDQFYRVEKSRSRDSGGSGLGLTIARRIVELHQGRIGLTSRDDWTEVTVHLPAST